MGGDRKNGLQELMLSPETIDRIHTMDEMLQTIYPLITQDLPHMKQLLGSIVTSQASMAASAASMAGTNERAENRYAILETRLQEVNDKASGKGQIPLLSHYIILVSSLLITLLGVLYVNQQTIEATMTSFTVKNATGK